jgi:hypothetical protein
MFTITFDELTLTIEGERFSYPMDGEADIADATDRRSPHVYSIRLMSNAKKLIELPDASPLFRPLSAAILATCENQIVERYEASVVVRRGQSYADEHRLGMRELL